jgi:hypothetical protein
MYLTQNVNFYFNVIIDGITKRVMDRLDFTIDECQRLLEVYLWGDQGTFVEVFNFWTQYHIAVSEANLRLSNCTDVDIVVASV